MTAKPEDFARQFASRWTLRDPQGLAALLTEDADFLSLTSCWCEGRKAIEATLQAEFAGTFARARLVTGKAKLRPLGPGAAVLHQRFVLSGLVSAQGQDMGRVGALMVAVLLAGKDGWQAISLQFAATADG
jgi:uncharacterized protein (TIGR02246 family)